MQGPRLLRKVYEGQCGPCAPCGVDGIECLGRLSLTRVVEAALAAAQPHRCRLLRRSQCRLRHDVARREVRHEIHPSVGCPPPYDVQPEVPTHRFGICRLCHRPCVDARYDARALPLQPLHVLLAFRREQAALRHDKSLVACAGGGAQQGLCPALAVDHRDCRGAEEIAFGDVVAAVAERIDGEDGAYEVGRKAVDMVYVEGHETLLAVLAPDVADGQHDEEVVVGQPRLQAPLARRHIAHQLRRVAPYRVRVRHIHRGVEFPAGPRLAGRRVAGAVQHDAVHARAEHQVEVGLHLRQRGAEMLRQPGERLARGQRLTRDVRRTRRVFQHREVRVVAAREAGVGAQPTDAEVGQAEALDLRDIDGGIDIDEVGGRAVRLVTHLHAVAVAPCRPLLREVLQQQLCQRLAVVARHLRIAVEKLRQAVFKSVAAAAAELLEQRRGPVGVIHLVAVVEEDGGHAPFRIAGKRLLEAFEIVRHGGGIEVVHHPALASRRGTLHLLPRAALVEHDDAALAAVARLVCAPHYLPGIAPLLHRRRQTDGIRHMAADNGVNDDELARRLAERHRRAAEGPSRAEVHIHLHADAATLIYGVAQHLHPAGREEGDVVLFVALNAVQRGDLHSADAVRGKVVQLPRDALRGHGRP